MKENKGEQPEEIKEGLRFKIRDYSDKTIFTIERIEGDKVFVGWGDKDRETEYLIKDVKFRFSFGDWIIYKSNSVLGETKDEKEIPDDFYPGKQHQRLFNRLHDKGFIALLSEMEEVINIVHEDFPSKVQEKEQQLIFADEIERQLMETIDERDQKIEELKDWKESAISVMPDMQAIGKALNVPLGQSVHDKILPGIERLKELIEKVHSEGYSNSSLKISSKESLNNFKAYYNLLYLFF